MKCVLRPRAERDLDEITEYLTAEANWDLALKFFSTAHETFALLTHQPMMGWPCRLRHPLLAHARVFRVGAPFTKYLIFYTSDADSIQILRVLHGSQDLERLFSET